MNIEQIFTIGLLGFPLLIPALFIGLGGKDLDTYIGGTMMVVGFVSGCVSLVGLIVLKIISLF